MNICWAQYMLTIFVWSPSWFWLLGNTGDDPSVPLGAPLTSGCERNASCFSSISGCSSVRQRETPRPVPQDSLVRVIGENEDHEWVSPRDTSGCQDFIHGRIKVLTLMFNKNIMNSDYLSFFFFFYSARINSTHLLFVSFCMYCNLLWGMVLPQKLLFKADFWRSLHLPCSAVSCLWYVYKVQNV